MATHSIVVSYVLWALLGWSGMHRFYLGKRTTGALWFLTAGLLGVGWLVDAFLLPSMRRKMANSFQVGRYNYSTGWLLLVFLGIFGAHRFYIGKWGTGLIYLCTGGVCGLGVLYDVLTYNDALSEANERWISGDPVFAGI